MAAFVDGEPGWLSIADSGGTSVYEVARADIPRLVADLEGATVVGVGLTALARCAARSGHAICCRVVDIGLEARLLEYAGLPDAEGSRALANELSEPPKAGPSVEEPGFVRALAWAETARRHAGRVRALVAQEELESVARLESDVLPVVADMEATGLLVDMDRFTEVVRQSRARAKDLERVVRERLGVRNPNDSAQIERALARVGVDTRSGTGKRELAGRRDIAGVPALLEFRRLRDFTGGLAKTLPKRVERDGRVRGRFDQLGAATGRISCSQPNLLAIPKKGASGLRRCFDPAPGCLFITADFKHCELRVLAEITGDDRLVDRLRSGADPHREVAARLAGKALEDVTDHDRAAAKAVAFGIPLGMGADTLAQTAMQFGLSWLREDAERHRNRYFDEFREVKAWYDFARSNGWGRVETCTGRVRLVRRDEGYPAILATLIQSPAADGMKHALKEVQDVVVPMGGRIALAIHDEVVVEAPRDNIRAIAEAVERAMVRGMSKVVKRVPVVVDVQIKANLVDPARS